MPGQNLLLSAGKHMFPRRRVQENGRNAVQGRGEHVWFVSFVHSRGKFGKLMCGVGTGAFAGCCPVGSVCVDSTAGTCATTSEGVRGAWNIEFMRMAMAGAVGFHLAV
jgi:hypothetical protein